MTRKILHFLLLESFCAFGFITGTVAAKTQQNQQYNNSSTHGTDDADTSLTLTPEKFVGLSVPSGARITIHVPATPSREDGGYSLIQAHSVLTNITISYTPGFRWGQSVTGSNVGLVLNGTVRTVYLINEEERDVQVLLLLQIYDENSPIPGGCNMELPVKTSPYLPTAFSTNIVAVEYPLGSYPVNVKPATCDRAPLQYDIYVYYLPEKDLTVDTAFQGLKFMTHVTSIEKYGTKVDFNGLPPSRVKFSNYAGTGRIVAIVLRTLTNSAAYVPSLSYGCGLGTGNPETDCEVLGSLGSKLLSASMVFIGLFLVVMGHRYYKCQLFLFGFLASGIVFYVGVSLANKSLGSAVVATTSTVVGAVGGAAWVIFWAKCGTPIGPVFLASFILGTLFASIVAFTPLVDYVVMKEDLTFWLAYFCLVLAVPLAIVSFDKLTSILVSSVVGAFIFTTPIDHYVGSNLSYIFFNMLRRATDPKFSSAIIQPPYQTKDIILTITWALVAIAGFIFQLWRERDRPPFPSTSGPWNWPSVVTRIRRSYSTSSNNEQSERLIAESSEPNERTPLLDSNDNNATIRVCNNYSDVVSNDP